MGKRLKLQKKIQRSTNHQTKENVLNQSTKLKIIIINRVINLRETRAIAPIKKNPKYFYKFIKNTPQLSELKLDLSRMKM